MTPKPASKPIIAVDVDDVLSDLNENIRHFMNREYGFNHTAEHYNIEGEYLGYWGPIWGVEGEDYYKRLDHYRYGGELSKQTLVPHSKKSLNKLKKHYNLVIITSREDKNRAETEAWLKKNFEDLFQGVHFAAVWDQGQKAEKAAICKAVGASYLIDDNATHCNLAAEAGIKALLFGDYGWNRNRELHPGVIRVKDWIEVMEYFNGQ